MKKMLLALAMIGSSMSAIAQGGESIVLDPATGNYLITYNQDGILKQITFVPRTKIAPVINSRLKLGKSEEMDYEYVLISERHSVQDIRLFILDPVSSVATDSPIPAVGAFSGDMSPTWMKSITDAAEAMARAANNFDTPQPWEASMSGKSGAFRIGWGYHKETDGLRPGGKAVFGFKSRDLPGIIYAQVSGYAPGSKKIPAESLPDANDGGFGQQYTYLTHNNFLRRSVAAPTISVPTPFDAAALLDRIQTQMHTWIGMKLLDPTFSSQLDRSLVAAADAYRHGQPKAAKEDIEQVREMLKKEHPDIGRDEEHESASNREKNDDQKPAVIDLLAARVLDFNLAYVLKRVEEGKEGKVKD